MLTHGGPAVPLRELEVLVVDCQATAAARRGHLLEIGWARVCRAALRTQARLIALPQGARIPPAVSRVTGISERMMRDSVDALAAWRELSKEAAELEPQPAPTVIHYARFELPFLRALANGASPLHVVCTHDVARRLLPDLPRCSLRALTGYFGRAVGALRRSADHVEATAFIWHELVLLLDAEGVSSWTGLQEWLATPAKSARRVRRGWPMPRDVRLALPDAPGIYRMLRTSGDILYIGKASSLHNRVNSYFRKQGGVHERTLEMLSQARGISFEVTPTALEAALLESDEIKKHRPPYNVALTAENRAVWFASPDLGMRSPNASKQYPLGPFPSAEELDQFAALARAEPAALARGRWGPDDATFRAGFEKLCAAHHEFSRDGVPVHAKLLRLGTRLWLEGRRDREGDEDIAPAAAPGTWSPELVQASLEWLALRVAHARRRAVWFTRLVDVALVWSEDGGTGAHMIVVERGGIVSNAAVDTGETPPVPPGSGRPAAERRSAFTLACFDRLRVLNGELKRLAASGAPVSLRFGEGRALDGPRLASALWWV
jgi:DNA polymerase III subunit epsilon